MEAVGQQYTTDETSYWITAKRLPLKSNLAEHITDPILEHTKLDHPARVLGDVIEKFFGSQTGRLTWYLIEYILWLRDFFEDAMFTELKISSSDEAVLDQHIYLVTIPNEAQVLISIIVHRKSVLAT